MKLWQLAIFERVVIVHIIHMAFCKAGFSLYKTGMVYEGCDAWEMQPKQFWKMTDVPSNNTTDGRG